MSVINLINDQLQSTFIHNTKSLIYTLSEQFDIDKNKLEMIWNSLNKDFKINNKTTIIVEDEEESVPILIKEEKVEIVIEDIDF